MNVYDSQRIADILSEMNYIEAKSLKDADLVLFNTCHIREKAAEKVFSDLGRINIVKNERTKRGLDTIIGVVGCVVQAENNEITKRAPYVDFAMGPLTYHRIPEVLAKVIRKRESQDEDSKNPKGIVDTDFPEEPKFDHLPKNRSHGGCDFVAIQEGCDNFCTYCVVPYTRGIEYSRPVAKVMEEIKRLASGGTLEINLLGQNVNSYHGEDEAGKERDLAYLLRRIAEIDEIKRIRYTTSYPADVNDNLISCHAELDKLMPYLHLPVQAGSDKILKAMNRRHTSGDYLNIVEKLNKANPKIKMASDFIVGFPGETDKDFEDTMNLVRQVGFIQSFSFKYSPRPGTPAAVMKNQIDEEVKKERLARLQDLLFTQQLEFNKESVGKTMEVLFEQKGRHEGQLVGRTPYMQNLHAKADEKLLNKIVKVKIVDATTNSLSGKLEG